MTDQNNNTDWLDEEFSRETPESNTSIWGYLIAALLLVIVASAVGGIYIYNQLGEEEVAVDTNTPQPTAALPTATSTPAGPVPISLENIDDLDLVQRFAGHEGQVFDVALSPDGRLAASGGDDGYLKIWDIENGVLVSSFLAHPYDVNVVTFTPDGQFVVTGGDDFLVKFWNVSDNTAGTNIDARGHILGIDISPDGQFMVTCSTNHTLRVWNVANGLSHGAWYGHDDIIRSIDYSPDGSRLASGSEDGKAILWDSASGEPLLVLDVGEKVFSVAYSPDGQVLAAGDERGFVTLFDTATGETLAIIYTGSDPLTSLAFSPDGLLLFASGHEAGLFVLDLDRQTVVHRIRQKGMRSIALTPDMLFLFSMGGDTVLVYGIE